MSLRLALITLVICALTTPSHAQLPSGWSGADIATPTAGSETYANGVYTITGAGIGLNQRGDQAHFTSTTLSSGGNFRITVHVASFTGGAGSQAGLMMRQDTNPLGTMGAVAYQPLKGKGTNPNLFSYFARNADPAAIYPWRSAGNSTAMTAPCWLQLIRYGNNFATYKSTDGTDWAQVQNTCGSAFTVSGPIQIGLFVSSGGTSTATATFDHLTIDTAPVLPYETSWIGNTFTADSDSYVSGGAVGMWVAPDGTCYVESFYDEGGEPGKSYKNGKIVHSFALHGGGAYEGSIACDGTHLYYFGRPAFSFHQIYQTNLAGDYLSGQPLYFQTPLIQGAGKTVRVSLSGLAYGNGELYASDPMTSQILVADPNHTTYGLEKNVINNVVTDKIDTSGVTNPAPEAVYQSQFQSDQIILTIPGLTAGQSYTVRLHFAELNPADNAPGKRKMDLRVGSQSVTAYDVFAKTGALDKADVVPFSDVQPDAGGNIKVMVTRGSGTVDTWGEICGIEILNADGSPFLKLNCGGGDVADWKSTIHEIPSRAFAFTRPGPIAVDKAGNLWIVQEGAPYPATGNFYATPGWAAIKSYDKNGNYLNKQITDVVNPTAISYDAASDHLLVAENGPDQNIRIYKVNTGAATAPALTGTFGIKGGIFAGKTPGLYHDDDAGGDARFFGPTGVGTDSAGNIYVLCNGGPLQTDLRAFSPNGTMLWSVFALDFCNTGDFDPTLDASDVWTPTRHYTMDYSGSTPGGEWKLKSYMANPFGAFKFMAAYQPGNTPPASSNVAPFKPNFSASSSVYRKIGPLKTPIMFTAGQGVLNAVNIYRFVGEQIVPCGSFTDKGKILVWIDANGDGIEQDSEVTTVEKTGGGMLTFDVDNAGNVYLAMGGTHSHNPNVQKFAFSSFNTFGVPVFSTASTSTPTPAPFDQVWGNKARLRYAGGPQDTMYLMAETNPNASTTDYDYGATLACYDHWSTTPTQRFVTVLPTPADNPNFLSGAPPYIRDGFVYEALDAANGLAFVCTLWGDIRVLDPQGKIIARLQPGPEVNGLGAWEDEVMGLRVHYNSAKGEYDILQESSGFRNRENFYRWTPAK